MKCPNCGTDIGMKDPKAIAEIANEELKNGASWHMITHKYFLKTDTRANADYNNAIIEEINNLLPEDSIGFSPFNVMLINNVYND